MHVRKRRRRRRSVERTMRSGRRSIASALPGGVEGCRVACTNGEDTEG